MDIPVWVHFNLKSTLPETNSFCSHLKFDGWKTIGANGLFLGANLLLVFGGVKDDTWMSQEVSEWLVNGV